MVAESDRELAREILRAVFVHNLGAPGRLNDETSVDIVVNILIRRRCPNLITSKSVDGGCWCLQAYRNMSIHDDMADFCGSSPEILDAWIKFQSSIGRI